MRSRLSFTHHFPPSLRTHQLLQHHLRTSIFTIFFDPRPPPHTPQQQLHRLCPHARPPGAVAAFLFFLTLQQPLLHQDTLIIIFNGGNVTINSGHQTQPHLLLLAPTPATPSLTRILTIFLVLLQTTHGSNPLLASSSSPSLQQWQWVVNHHHAYPHIQPRHIPPPLSPQTRASITNSTSSFLSRNKQQQHQPHHHPTMIILMNVFPPSPAIIIFSQHKPAISRVTVLITLNSSSTPRQQ